MAFSKKQLDKNKKNNIKKNPKIREEISYNLAP
jgi:hypothetical protein